MKMKNKIIITIEGYKFDITGYVDQYHNGASILKKFNGKDATDVFNVIKGHNESTVIDMLDKFCIGKA
jgi:cytochrome b involved in lipid metabolism